MRIWQSVLVMLSVAVFLGFSSQLYAKGFDGANAPGGQQVGGAPMADKDGGIGFQTGKPYSTGGVSQGSTPQSKGMGGAGKGGGRGDGSGPWGSKGAMGGQRGKGL